MVKQPSYEEIREIHAPTASGTRSPAGAMVIGASATVVGLLPVFLVGAMAVQLTEDLAFGVAALGAAVGIFRATGAATSVFLGRLADRLGATASLRLATSIAAVASLGIAITATTWATLVAWLMIGSCANALAQPAANRLLVNNVPHGRQGAAFGFKQSAPPTASMLAGLSVPLIALTLGWRWAYGLAAALAVAVLIAVGRRPPAAQRTRRADASRPKLRDRRTVLVLAGALGLSTAASSAVTSFYVDAGVRAGSSESAVGSLLAVASVAAIVMRLGLGVLADRIPSGHLRLCAALLVAGSLGFGLLAIGRPLAMAAGAVIALAGTWGFNGVFVFAVIRTQPENPGTITGAVMPGGLFGATIGPMLFGIVAATVNYASVWALAGVVALIAAVAMFLCTERVAAVATGPERPHG